MPTALQCFKSKSTLVWVADNEQCVFGSVQCLLS